MWVWPVAVEPCHPVGATWGVGGVVVAWVGGGGGWGALGEAGKLNGPAHHTTDRGLWHSMEGNNTFSSLQNHNLSVVFNYSKKKKKNQQQRVTHNVRVATAVEVGFAGSLWHGQPWGFALALFDDPGAVWVPRLKVRRGQKGWDHCLQLVVGQTGQRRPISQLKV